MLSAPARSATKAASTLPAQRFELAPVDLYNVLLTLRMRKAKKPPRALRYELVPGEKPKLVLEPWDLVLEGTGPVFEGARPRPVHVEIPRDIFAADAGGVGFTACGFTRLFSFLAAFLDAEFGFQRFLLGDLFALN